MRSILLLACLLFCLVDAVEAQTNRPDPYAARIALGAESYTWQSVRGAEARPLSQQTTRPTAKPFNTIVQSPTVSPYLNLYREEQAEGVPNYFSFVRPQQRQIQAMRSQAGQLQQIERRVQQATYTAPAQPTAGQEGLRAARFGDTGRYYGAWR